MYRRLEFYFETSPLKTNLYFSVWCTNLSHVRQEMSNESLFMSNLSFEALKVNSQETVFARNELS